MVSSLVSGCRKVSLKVACARMTVNRKKMQIDSAIIAGVLLRFFGWRVGGVTWQDRSLKFLMRIARDLADLDSQRSATTLYPRFLHP